MLRLPPSCEGRERRLGWTDGFGLVAPALTPARNRTSDGAVKTGGAASTRGARRQGHAVNLSRRRFLGLAGAAAVVGAGGLLGLDEGLRHKLEQAWAYTEGPDLALPASGARMVTGSFDSRCMRREVAWAYSLPAQGRPRAVVVSLYGKDANLFAPFDSLHLPDAAAYVGVPLSIASADGGGDNYWHKRANGTDAHAMVVDELVPLLARRRGPFPLRSTGTPWAATEPCSPPRGLRQ